MTPLREGGSLPAVMEADDLGTYVVKFRGAGQGRKALVAEIISAGLASACGLAVPDLVTVDLDPALAPGEPDQEIQDLLRASGGLNLGVDFLPGALDFETGAATVDPGAGRPDHLVRRAGLQRGPVLAQPEHAALARHPLPDRPWRDADFPPPLGQRRAAAARPYDIAEHALLGCGALVEEADAELAPRLTAAVLRDAVRAGAGRSGWPTSRVSASVDAAAGRPTSRSWQLGWRPDPSWLPQLAAAAAAGLANVAPADRAGGGLAARPG